MKSAGEQRLVDGGLRLCWIGSWQFEDDLIDNVEFWLLCAGVVTDQQYVSYAAGVGVCEPVRNVAAEAGTVRKAEMRLGVSAGQTLLDGTADQGRMQSPGPCT